MRHSTMVLAMALLAPLAVLVYAGCPGQGTNSDWPWNDTGPEPIWCARCQSGNGVWDSIAIGYVDQPCCDQWTVHCPHWYYTLHNQETVYRLRVTYFYCEIGGEYHCNHQVDPYYFGCYSYHLETYWTGNCC